MRAAIADPADEWATEAHRLTARDPKGYGRRIVFLALVGTAILHSVWVLSLLGALALTAVAAWFQVWWPALPAAGLFAISGRWLWVLAHPIRHDFGVRLDRDTAPALFDLLGKVVQQVGAPHPTHVFLVPDFNAWVQVRRRAKGEWRLSIGLPLMLATDVPQLSAVIGHEMGHFAAGTAGARLVWAQQADWPIAMLRLGDTLLGVLVRSAFRNWGRRFQAEAVAMARNHERTADAAGAKVAGAQAAGQALIAMDLLQRTMFERFWPQIWARAPDGPPPDDVFIDLRHFLEATQHEDYDRYYRAALGEATLAFDVHPSLSDRLLDLKVKPSLPSPPRPSAAVALLGDKLDALSQQLGRWWVSQVKHHWKAWGEETLELNRRLAADGHRPPAELHPHDALQIARALRRSHRVAEAVPFYQRAVSLGSGDGNAHLGLGLALLELGDPKGLAELKTGVSLCNGNEESVVTSFVAARRFLEARGERAEKNPFTRDYHRLRLRDGRRNALGEWGKFAIL